MVFSAVSSGSYRRTLSPLAEGQPRRDGHAGRLFSLPQQADANDDIAETATGPAVATDGNRQVSHQALENWMRLMGAARQMAYQEDSPAPQSAPAQMRYRLQRTYYDQERQAMPQLPDTADARLEAYQQAAGRQQQAQWIDFVV